MIPPTVDLSDFKWSQNVRKDKDTITFIYAGVPSSTKEKLNIIVDAFSCFRDKVHLDIIGVTEEQFKSYIRYNILEGIEYTKTPNGGRNFRVNSKQDDFSYTVFLNRKVN